MIPAQTLRPDSLLTSHQAGALLQVTPASIIKWVKDGRITAFRTPGGHRRIRARDLLEFVARHNMPVPEALARAGKRRLLIVDDDRVQLRSLERRLKRHAEQIEVALVDNGIQALILVGEIKPHLVVLDVFMPEIDGLEVCRQLKTRASTSHIKVVVTSGRMTPKLEEEALSAGAVRCLPKPIAIDLLLAEVAET